jgi:hypothetical protein
VLKLIRFHTPTMPEQRSDMTAGDEAVRLLVPSLSGVVVRSAERIFSRNNSHKSVQLVDSDDAMVFLHVLTTQVRHALEVNVFLHKT